MSISIATNRAAGVLEVRYAPGSVTAMELARQRPLVAEALSQSGFGRVLVDASALERVPSIVTTLEHNEGIATNSILRKARFAIVFTTMGQDEQDLETTAVSRGVHLKCFTSREAALAWLS